MGNAIPARFWAFIERRWFVVCFAGGMLLAGVWLGARIGRGPTIIVNRDEPMEAPFEPVTVFERAHFFRGSGWRPIRIEGQRRVYGSAEFDWMEASVEPVGSDGVYLFSISAHFDVAESTTVKGTRMALAMGVMSETAGVSIDDWKRLLDQLQSDGMPILDSVVSAGRIADRDAVLVLNPTLGHLSISVDK